MKNKKAFTIIELIIYIALLSIFISAAILFSWDIIYGKVKSNTQQEVTQNLRFTSRRILSEIRNAYFINSVSASEICLVSLDPSRNPTRIYLNSGQINIAWGGGTTDCTNMLNDAPLTSNDLTASNLTFTNLSSSPETLNIKFIITLESTGERVEFKEIQSISSSAEIRSN